jgi:hypothetical protein
MERCAKKRKKSLDRADILRDVESHFKGELAKK